MMRPQSVALVGVSGTVGRIGNKMFRYLVEGGYQGRIYPVNPRYDTFEEYKCYASLSDLPEVPDLVMLGVGGRFIEAAFDEAIRLGAGGAVIFFSNYLENDSEPPLLERLKQKAKVANFPVCGGNGMGFYNYDVSLLASFDLPPQRPAGHIALIAHSGSVMTYMTNNDARYGFNIAVSPGQEINGTVADYMLYALEQSSTRIIALFLEAVRDVPRFIEALAAARDADIPVVITKIGRTEKSARFAASHSGALAGNDQAFQAVCDRYGVLRAGDMDELLATAQLFAQGKRAAPGGVASIFDSGGLREQMIDLAEEYGIPLANVSAETRAKLANTLEFGLEPDNPLDAMGEFSADLEKIWTACVDALANDPDTALMTIEFEFRDHFSHYPELYNVIYKMLELSDKPNVVLSSSCSTLNTKKAIELTQAGIPMISGIDVALRAIRNMLRYRDYRALYESQRSDTLAPPDPAIISQWRQRIASGQPLDESAGLALLAAAGLPAMPFRVVESAEAAAAAAQAIGFPLVMKTAEPHILHKSDVGGVALNITKRDEVVTRYTRWWQKFGPRVLLAPMVAKGTELAFGMVNDEQFGPIVMLSAGGIFVELLDDVIFALPPFTVNEARRLIEQLKIHKLLKGVRGNAPARVDLAAEALSRFSQVVAELGEVAAEIDLNPVIVGSEHCTIVDCLIVPK